MAKPKPIVTLRKPPKTPANLGAVDAFVHGDKPAPKRSNVQVLKRPDVQTSKATVTRSDGRELRRMTVYLPAELAKRLRVHCAEADVDLSTYLAELVSETL